MNRRHSLRKWYARVDPDDAPMRPFREVDRAHRLLRRTKEVLDVVAEEEGWPAPCSPLRYLVLAHLRQRRALKLRPRRLARLLELRPSTLAHHLDVLESSDLVRRVRGGRYDGRRVDIELTEAGNYALWRMSRALERSDISPEGSE